MPHPRIEEVIEARTLIDLLQRRGIEQASDVGYIFLVDGEELEERLTFGELCRQARAVGAMLQRRGLCGERVLLVYPQGLEYLKGFFGALYGGAIAVPTWPPDADRMRRTFPRLQAVARDARIGAVLTTASILALMEQAKAEAPELGGVPWIATDRLEPGIEDGWTHPGSARGDIAYLQYTSGSTGTPKGVLITHDGLLRTVVALDQCFEHTTESVMVSWLPIFHDLGLIYGALQGVALGFLTVLLSPIQFVQRPARWLRAISRYRGTHACSPNFGYALCARKIMEDDKRDLDLSAWKLAMNAAEPVRKQTQEAFIEAFSASGFRSRTFAPCYGLAEVTLRATNTRLQEESTFVYLDPEALRQGRAVPITTDRQDGRWVACCGHQEQEFHTLVVDPETRTAVADGIVGELWFASPALPLGYFNRPDATDETFRARLADGAGPYVRTGDLGFVLDGGVYVAGRLKDLIIIHGENHYPQDIEWAVEACHPAIRPSCSAAFSVDAGAEERLVVVVEVDPRKAPDHNAVFTAVAQAVFEQHEMQVYAIALVQPGSIHKASNGKIQRRLCKDAWLKGDLTLIDDWRLVLPADVRSERPPDLRSSVQAATSLERTAIVTVFVREQVARLLGVEEAELDPARPLETYGLTSVSAVELAEEVGAAIGKNLPARFVLTHSTVNAIVAFALHELTVAPGPPTTPPEPPAGP